MGVLSQGFTDTQDGCRAILSAHLALVADAAVTAPLRDSALKTVLKCRAQRAQGGSASAITGGGRGGAVVGSDGSVSVGCNALEGGDRRYCYAFEESLRKGGWSLVCTSENAGCMLLAVLVYAHAEHFCFATIRV